MVSENAERMGSYRPASDMKNSRQQLAGDLIHIGNHKQQALGRGECRRKGSCGERTMRGSGRSQLAFHLTYLHRGSHKVFSSRYGPFVSGDSHRCNRCDRINGGYLAESVGYVGSRCTAVHVYTCRFLSHAFGVCIRKSPPAAKFLAAGSRRQMI